MSELGQALFVCGDRSGVGKTSVCIGLLNALSYVYDPSEIAYIKPCTQCESVQLLWKFCHLMGIHCEGLGPIIYYRGYTQECISGQHGDANDRLNKIKDSITNLRQKYKFVIIDGVGYPGVGSCVGCSNAQMASYLHIPVLMISQPGVGNMIDTCVMNVEYMAYHKVQTLGTIINKLPIKKISYHTSDNIKTYCSKFFESYKYTIQHINDDNIINNNIHNLSVYGFIPAYNDDIAGCSVTCNLKHREDPITDEELQMNDNDYHELTLILRNQQYNVKFQQIFTDISTFYNK